MNLEARTMADELKSVFEDFKSKHSEVKGEVKKYGEETRETRNSLTKIHDRLDEVETRLSRPAVRGQQKLQEQSAYTKAFNRWFSTGDEAEMKSIMPEIKATFPNLNETIDPQGGYLVPPEYANFLIDALVQWSPIRRYARIIKVNSKEFKIPVQQQAQVYNPTTGLTEAAAGLFRTGWTADLGPVPQTATGQFNLKTIPTNDLYALPAATQDMLDDAFFDVESYLQMELAKSFAYAEGAAFINGTGIGQPFGLVTSAPTFNQVTPTTGVVGSLGDGSDVMIDAFYSLPDFYARNGTWLMARQTIRVVREFTDGNGQYLWTPVYGETLKSEAPALILGRPYAECVDMQGPTGVGAGPEFLPTYPAGSVPILFGDIYSAYVIADRMGIRVLRDPYTDKPFVLFYTTRRLGGEVVLPEAMVAVNVQV